MADVLDRTARQVRLPGGTIHKLTSARTVPGQGRTYRTRCGARLTAQRGAILTTRPVGCSLCTGSESSAQRAREMVEAILGEVSDG